MESKRVMSIDILKFFSMIGILCLHFLLQGGILNNLESNNINFYFFWIIEIVSMCSVNVFAIITGYLYIDKKKYNNTNIVNLILTMIFYSFVITTVFYSLDLYNIRNLGIMNLLIGIFPPVIGKYWYITAYALLFFMIPYINIFIQNIDKRKYKSIIIILTLAFCVFSLFLTKDSMKIEYGYSPFWLIYCYLLGGYIKKYNIKINKIMKICFIGIVLILLGLKAISPYSKIISKIFVLLINYNSPITVLNSVIIFLYFKDKNIVKGTKLINYLSLTSFGVYIIHCHAYIFDYILKDLFNTYFDVNNIFFILIFIGLLLLTYLVCSTIEFAKIKLFETKIIKKIEQFIVKIIDKTIGYNEG